jgi:hypothetical protein
MGFSFGIQSKAKGGQIKSRNKSSGLLDVKTTMKQTIKNPKVKRSKAVFCFAFIDFFQIAFKLRSYEITLHPKHLAHHPASAPFFVESACEKAC